MSKVNKPGIEDFDKEWLDGLINKDRPVEAASYCVGKFLRFADYFNDVSYHDKTPVDIFIQKTDTFQRSVNFLDALIKINPGLGEMFTVPEYLNTAVFRDLVFPRPDAEILTHAKIDVALAAFQVNRDVANPKYIKNAKATFDGAVNAGLELTPSTLFKGGLTYYFDALLFTKFKDPARSFDAGTKAYFLLMQAGDGKASTKNAPDHDNDKVNAADVYYYAGKIVGPAGLPPYAEEYAKQARATAMGTAGKNILLAMDTDALGPFDKEFISYLNGKINGTEKPDMSAVMKLLAKEPPASLSPADAKKAAIMVIGKEKVNRATATAYMASQRTNKTLLEKFYEILNEIKSEQGKIKKPK